MTNINRRIYTAIRDKSQNESRQGVAT